MSLTNEELKWATILALTEPPTLSREVQITSIMLIKPPNKLEYDNGELINFDGMVVVYVDSDGNRRGVVPFSKLRFPIRTADIEESETIIYRDNSGQLKALYVPITLLVQIPMLGDHWYYDGLLGNEDKLSTAMSDAPSIDLITKFYERDGRINNYAMNLSGSTALNRGVYRDGTFYPDGGSSARAGVGRFSVVSWAESWNLLPISTSLDGTITMKEGTQTIPVEWVRPSDGAVLTVSFDISVTSPADL